VARIAIDARVVTSERDGVGRYARGLVPALAAAAPQHRFLVLRHPSSREPVAGDRPNVREVYVEGTTGRMVDHFLVDHRRLRDVFETEGWPDLYHALFHMYALAFPRRGDNRPAVVVTLHDLIWLDFPFAHGPLLAGLGTWVKARTAVAHSLRSAAHVIAVSRATADAGSRHRWLSADRLSVIHHGIATRFLQPAAALPARFAFLEGDGRPWVAALGESKRYKNLAFLVEAFARATARGLEARLVLLGRCASLAATARRFGVADRVFFPGELEDDALHAVMGGAALFVHPAIVEGFGMPVVEAMALGTPTAVADVPALAEVGGSGVLCFDPHDSGALADIMLNVVGSEEMRKKWSARARTRAACFDWNKCAEATLEIYARVLAGERR
jgi:glycosyltransferase involved in cell wall biosynthesis